MTKFLTAAALLCLATPANADYVIKGRDAQALQCAALLMMVSTILEDADMLSEKETQIAHIGAAIMLDTIPGSKRDKTQAMRQRLQRIVDSRTIEELAEEYATTAKWCNRTFLPK